MWSIYTIMCVLGLSINPMCTINGTLPLEFENFKTCDNAVDSIVLELNQQLKELFPTELNSHVWNRKVVQMGMSDMALEKLEEIKSDLGAEGRSDLRSFADVIEFDEGRLE